MIVKRCIVSGRVQGVYYRASTQQEARRLNLMGHANNLADGRVEVLVVGEAQRVDALVQWLWKGSPASHVTAVDAQDVDASDLSMPASFTTG